jgi:hypothetical protein
MSWQDIFLRRANFCTAPFLQTECRGPENLPYQVIPLGKYGSSPDMGKILGPIISGGLLVLSHEST